jgi:uncharacterized protein (TIGR02996 family)
MSARNVFVADIITNPSDSTARLIFADWLDDRGDPRGVILRWAQSLLDVPRRESREDVPVKVWRGLASPKPWSKGRPYGNPDALRTSRPEWPQIEIIPNARRMGVRGLGRVLACVYWWEAYHAAVRWGRSPWIGRPNERAVFGEWARRLLYNCGILTVAERDGGYKGGALHYAALRFSFGLDSHPLASALGACRSHAFGCYVTVAHSLQYQIAEPTPTDASTRQDEYLLGHVGRAAVAWTRLLDLFDVFRETIPWHAADELYRENVRRKREAYLARRINA